MRFSTLVRVVLVGCAAAGPLSGQSGVFVGPAFRVNTYTSTLSPYPRAALDAQGAFLVVWTGYNRDGDQFSIHGRRFDAAGAPIAGEFRISNVTSQAGYQVFPVAAATLGGFVVVWQARIAGAQCCDVLGRRYGSDGAPLGDEFRVNVTTTGAQKRPSVAVAGNGSFVVTWDSETQNGVGLVGIHARRFGPSGAPITSEFRVSADPFLLPRSPRAASDAAGNVVIVYELGGLLGRRYDPSGAPIGGEFEVDADGTTADVAAFPSGGFVVAWAAGDGGGEIPPGADVGIFARRYDAAGVPTAPAFRVNTYTTAMQHVPSVTASSDGFLVAWAGQPIFAPGMRAQFFKETGEPNGTEFVISMDGRPTVASNAHGAFLATWEGVFAQRLVPPLARAGAQQRVNTVVTGTQSNPRVAETSAGDLVVVWSNGATPYGAEGEVSAQRFSGNGVALGGELRVNSYTPGKQEAGGVVGYPGGFVVVWQGPGTGDDGGVFAQRFTSAGSLSGAEFRVNAATSGGQESPRVARLGSGFLVVWRDANPARSGLLALRFSGSGAPLDADFRVNTTTLGYTSRPAIAASASAGFVVAWTGGTDTLVQRFDANALPVGAEFRVNDQSVIQKPPAVAMDADGTFVVSFARQNGGASIEDVFARRFSATGAPIGDLFLVNSYTTSRQDSPALASGDGGGFVVSWRSYFEDGSESGVFAQLYKKSGLPATGAFRVNATTTLHQNAPAVSLGSSVAVVWESADEDFTGIYGQFYRAPCRSSDENGDGSINVSDVLYLINNLFAGGPGPVCGGDANGDASLNVADVLYLINYLFAGGPAPA